MLKGYGFSHSLFFTLFFPDNLPQSNVFKGSFEFISTKLTVSIKSDKS